MHLPAGSTSLVVDTVCAKRPDGEGDVASTPTPKAQKRHEVGSPASSGLTPKFKGLDGPSVTFPEPEGSATRAKREERLSEEAVV